MCVWVCLCVQACVWWCKRVCGVCVSVCFFIGKLRWDFWLSLFVSKTHIATNTAIDTHNHLYTHTYIYVHAHTDTHTHAYTHAHTHTHTLSLFFSLSPRNCRAWCQLKIHWFLWNTQKNRQTAQRTILRHSRGWYRVFARWLSGSRGYGNVCVCVGTLRMGVLVSRDMDICVCMCVCK